MTLIPAFDRTFHVWQNQMEPWLETNPDESVFIRVV